MIEGLGGTVTRDTHFPIAETRKAVIDAIEKGAIDGTTLDVATVIIEIMEPYKGRNDSLYTLHRLDILDKHRMIIPTYSMSPLIFTEGGQPTGPDVYSEAIHVNFRRGKVQEQYVSGNLQLQRNHKSIVFVFLDNVAHGFPSEDVFLRLRRLAGEVRDNLETLAKEYVTLRNRTLS
jgi:hypothetical protein